MGIVELTPSEAQHAGHFGVVGPYEFLCGWTTYPNALLEF